MDSTAPSWMQRSEAFAEDLLPLSDGVDNGASADARVSAPLGWLMLALPTLATAVSVTVLI